MKINTSFHRRLYDFKRTTAVQVTVTILTIQALRFKNSFFENINYQPIACHQYIGIIDTDYRFLA